MRERCHLIQPLETANFDSRLLTSDSWLLPFDACHNHASDTHWNSAVKASTRQSRTAEPPAGRQHAQRRRRQPHGFRINKRLPVLQHSAQTYQAAHDEREIRHAN